MLPNLKGGHLADGEHQTFARGGHEVGRDLNTYAKGDKHDSARAKQPLHGIVPGRHRLQQQPEEVYQHAEHHGDAYLQQLEPLIVSPKQDHLDLSLIHI